MTPFATPVLRRALHAVAVSYVRQNSPMTIGPDPFPRTAYQEAIDLLRDRAVIAEPDDLPMLEHIARDRATQWSSWERTEWDANPAPYGVPLQGLMRYAGTLPDLDRRATIWDVPTNTERRCGVPIGDQSVNILEGTEIEEIDGHRGDATSATSDAIRCRRYECSRQWHICHYRRP